MSLQILIDIDSHYSSKPLPESMLTYDLEVPQLYQGVCQANERRRYNVTTSLIGWAHN